MLELIGSVVVFIFVCTTVAAVWSLFKWLCLRSSYQFGKLLAGLLYGVPKAVYHAFKYAFVPLHSRIEKAKKSSTNNDEEHAVTFDGKSGRDIIDINAKRKERQVLEGEFLENPTKRVNQKRNMKK